MVRFAANLNFLFTETPFLDRFELAKRHGFEAVEYPFPYENPEDELARRLREHGLTQALINLPAGDWGKGERGIACHPGRTEEFREGVATAIRYAQALDCPRANCLAGVKPEGVSDEAAQAALVENLRYAGQAFREAGLQLLTEPINTRDIPGFFLNTSAQGLAVMEAVGDGLVGLQYDAYHMQIMEGDLARTVEENLDVIGHIQIADNPGRHEPGTGEVNYPFFLDHLDAIGYEGWVGCEYAPATTTEAGLGWLAEYRASEGAS
ncbi:MAG: hydroxypyruvate isomerase [Chloroflexi bacterium]|nr:hydroxypyruvate isomerase [Chloroflexota bacterium]